MNMGSPPRFCVSFCLAAGLVLLGVATPAWSQSDEVQAEASSDDELSGATLSPKQKVDFASRVAKELRTSLNKVLNLVQRASGQKDVIKLNCLNDKLVSIRALLKVAEQSSVNLAEAVARENLDLQEHNYRKVYIAQQQGVTVAAEADACVGQVGLVSSGQTRVVVNVEGGSTEGDVSFGAAASGSSRPPDASPFRN